MVPRSERIRNGKVKWNKKKTKKKRKENGICFHHVYNIICFSSFFLLFTNLSQFSFVVSTKNTIVYNIHIFVLFCLDFFACFFFFFNHILIRGISIWMDIFDLFCLISGFWNFQQLNGHFIWFKRQNFEIGANTEGSKGAFFAVITVAILKKIRCEWGEWESFKLSFKRNAIENCWISFESFWFVLAFLHNII